MRANTLCVQRRRALFVLPGSGLREPVVDVLILRIMRAHEQFCRLDHARGVADDMAIGAGGARSVTGPREQRRAQDCASLS